MKRLYKTGIFVLCTAFIIFYHMNKEKWITVSLDGRVPDGQIKWLLDLSFALTAPRMKKHRT